MSFIRPSTMRTGLPPRVLRPRPMYSNQKRFVANATGNKGGTIPRALLVLAALAVPASFWLSRRGSGLRTAAQSSQGARQKSTSTHNEPRAMGPPGEQTSMSAKQQGLSNADTMHPYVNEPGKSQKGEGETETTKLKGTVRTDRPQA